MFLVSPDRRHPMTYRESVQPMEETMNQEKIPLYVDPSTIKSKFANAIARMADYAWWLMKHRNYVIGLGFDFTDGALSGGTILKMHQDYSFKTIGEVVDECLKYVTYNTTQRGRQKLRTIYVNGGNGKDRPGIPIYKVTL
jgi:hypothetical protein